MKKWFEKAWQWIIAALAFIGAIAMYILMSKDDADKKVNALETDIKNIEKNIKKKEKDRKKYIAKAEVHGAAGANIDKEIKKAKAKQRNLDEKRKKLKEILSKYE